MNSNTRNILISAAIILILAAAGALLWSRGNRAPDDSTTDVTATTSASEETEAATAVTSTGDAVAADCVNDAAFVEDVSLADGTEVTAGEDAVKTWRIRNTGTCPWTGDYQLRFAGGDQLNGPIARRLAWILRPPPNLMRPLR